jgi:hypothetical protein
MRSKVLLAATACLLWTGAAAQAQTFTEGFENVAGLPGAGWALINNSQPIGTSGWKQGNPTVFPAQAGSPASYANSDFTAGGGVATISNWMITPPVMLANGATMTFWTRKIDFSGASFPDRMQVRMSTAGNSTDVGTTATSVGVFTELLLDINPTYSGTGYPYSWTQFDVVVTGVPTPTLGRFAFRYFVENGGPGGTRSDYIGVDTASYTIPASVAPVSLAVDPTGNLVLEANETAVEVRPTWQNTGGTTIAALTGTLSNFMGPVGGTYVINDGSASYGSLAPGVAAACTDCYAVTVTAATRPSVHWDASALETVSVGPTTHTWDLHIGGSFSDVPASNPFYRFIETLLHHGITSGCTATEYCPSASTSREQMAVFALVAKEGQGYAPPLCTPPNLFNDVPETSPFCRWIEELANRGVVSGCGGGNYCPTQAVTREEMAVFMLRTLDPTLVPPACAPPNLFNDVPETSGFCRWIEELANRGVVGGCGGGNYCPSDPVTREQMGVFISSTFGLTLYGL